MPKKSGKKLTIAEKIVEGLQEFADALESEEEITDQFTCHKVVLDLEPTEYEPQLVKATRTMLGASQAIFAQFLGVSVNTVHDWEQGKKPPRNLACRFMDEIRRNPDYWRSRLRESVKPKRRSPLEIDS